MADILEATEETPEVTTPSVSSKVDSTNPLSYAAGITKLLSQAGTTYTPEQRQDLANMSYKMQQHAFNQMQHDSSPLRKIGSVLNNVGASIAGMGGNNSSFSNMANMSNIARNNNSAREQKIVSELKAAQQLANAGADPKQISSLLKGYESGAKIAQNKINSDIKSTHEDNMKVARSAAQDTRDVLALNQVEHWQNSDNYHQNVLKQREWIRNSINTLEQDKLKLEKYKAEISANKATADTKFKAQKLEQEMAVKFDTINQNINKTNIATEMMLSKVGKDGKPIYRDENGQAPVLNKIPLLSIPQAAEEGSPLPAFPEAPQIAATPAVPQGMQAQPAQALPQQVPQGGYTSIGAMPTNIVGNLPTGDTLPPNPAPLRNPARTPSESVKQVSKIKQSKAPSVEITPQAKTLAQRARDYHVKHPDLTPAQAVQQVLSEAR